MLYKVSKKYEKCRDTIQRWYDNSYWDQGSHYSDALKQIELKDNDLEKKIREIEKEMKPIMIGKHLNNFGKRKRKRKFGSTSVEDVYGKPKRSVNQTYNTNIGWWDMGNLFLKYRTTYNIIPEEVRKFMKSIANELASIDKLDKSWKEVTDAMIKILNDEHYTPKKPLPLSHRTYAENMNLMINLIISGKDRKTKNIPTPNFKSNVQTISSFLTESLGEIGNKRSLTKDDILSIFCSGISIKVNEKAKKQAEKIIDDNFQ